MSLPNLQSNDIGYIKVLNEGVYEAYFVITYIFEGEVVKFETDSMQIFDVKIIFLPNDATNIVVDFYIATFIELWYKVKTIYIPTLPHNCYKYVGTIFNPDVFQFPCD